MPLIDSSSPEGDIPETFSSTIDFTNVNFSYPTRPTVPVRMCVHVHGVCMCVCVLEFGIGICMHVCVCISIKLCNSMVWSEIWDKSYE